MKKRVSIHFRLILRMGVSIIFFISYLIFNNILFSIGRLENLNLINGLIIFILSSACIIMLVISTESVCRESDPINPLNVNKYRIIFIMEVITMISNSFILMNYELNVKMSQISNSIIIILGLIAVGIHSSIIKRYKALSQEKINELISNYQLSVNEKLLSMLSVIKMKIVYLIGYLIICGVFMKYPMYNVFTSMIFMGINIRVLYKLFYKELRELYSYYGKVKKAKKILWEAYVFSTVGYIFIYLTYKKSIYVPVLSGCTLDEMSVLWFLFFIPFYRYLIKDQLTLLRMIYQWW